MTGASHDYADIDPEAALKYAIQHIRGDRAQVVEGVIEQVAPTWDHEAAADSIRQQIAPKLRSLGCVAGSGDLDLPGSSNWYIPDIAVVAKAWPRAAARCSRNKRCWSSR